MIKLPVKNILITLWDLIKHYFWGLYNRIGEHHVFLMAGGLSFSLIICIVPMVLIIFAGLGMVLEQPSISGEIDSFIDRAIPYEQYATSIKQIVSGRINEFRIYKSLAGMAGIIGLLIASSGLFSSMRTILRQTYKIPVVESALIGKLRDFGMVLLVMVYFLLSTLILPGVDIFANYASKLNSLAYLRLDLIQNYIVTIISFSIIFVSFFIVYFLIPRQRLPVRIVAISALSAAILWELAKEVFGFYITSMATYKKIYGAYAILIVVVFWIYYTSIVFILGAEIGQLYREWREKRNGAKTAP